MLHSPLEGATLYMISLVYSDKAYIAMDNIPYDVIQRIKSN